MQFKLKYGNDYKTLDLEDKNVISELNIKSTAGLDHIAKEFGEKLDGPIGSPSLREIAQKKKGSKVVIVVSDYTRAIPYHGENYNLLEQLIDYLNESGVTDSEINILVGGGTHRFHTKEENLANFGEKVVSRVTILDHDCDNDVVELGTMSTGNPLWVNKHINSENIVILTGLITTHYFAGFSGGRKAILPATAGRETVRSNHAMVLRDGVGIGKLDGNPIAIEMAESAKMTNPDFLINFVVNDKKEITHLACGDIEEAYKYGVEMCKENYTVELEQLADVAFVSAGGYPKDANLLQVQKTLNNGKELIKKGGTLVLICECKEGVGSPTFEKWLKRAESTEQLVGVAEEDLEIGGHTAANTAKQLHNYDIVLVSEMSQDNVEQLLFNWEPSVEAAMERVKRKHGENFSSYVVPYGGLIFPVKN